MVKICRFKHLGGEFERRGRILYGAEVVPSDDLRARQPRRIQSAFAGALAAELGTSLGSGTLISKSHSRALVASACAGPPVCALGIDIEWAGADRAFAGILANFLPEFSAPVSRGAFYRAWTFLEAHFKAHQRWPRPEELRQVLAAPERDGAWQTVDGNHLIQHRIAGDFQLTVLWRSEAPCEIEYRPPSGRDLTP